MPTVLDVTERSIVPLGRGITARVGVANEISSSAVFGTARVNITVTAVGIAPVSLTGSPTLLIDLTAEPGGIAAGGAVSPVNVRAAIHPAAISGGSASGSPQFDAVSAATEIASTATFGNAKTVASVKATGFATPGTVGAARSSQLMLPAGIASGEAFGDADTSTIMLVIPGAVDPADGFGDAVVTRRGWVFRPPVNTYKWRLFKEYEGISLLKENGVWSEVAHPDLPRTKAAEKYLAGGRDHVVGDALKAELVALGYTVTQEVVTTEEFL